MPESLYARAHQIAHAVLEGEPALQASLLMQFCGDDVALLQEVRWLLAAADNAALDATPNSIQVLAEDVFSNARIDGAAPGRYRLLEQIGEGGMGVVWLAQRELGGVQQRVALKRLRLNAVADARETLQRVLADFDIRFHTSNFAGETNKRIQEFGALTMQLACRVIEFIGCLRKSVIDSGNWKRRSANQGRARVVVAPQIRSIAPSRS